jgi:opacity protein-like surface antigen
MAGAAAQNANLSPETPSRPMAAETIDGIDSPLVPGTTWPVGGEDAGSVLIGGLDSPMGPLMDPNLNDMPALDDMGVGILFVDEEASDKTWRIRPLVSTGFVYDDNIFISNTDRKGAGIFNINGGFALEVGDYRTLQENFLLLEYLATGFFFTRYTEQNSFNQQAALLGQYRFNQLAVQLESTYQYLNGAQRQIGGFATRTLLFNALRFLYDYSEKTSFDLEVSQTSNIYDSSYNSAYYFEALAGMDYRIFPKVRIGLEGNAGFVQADNNPGMTYQTANARAKYDLTGKVALKATGGVQFVQFQSGGEDMRVTPVFSLGAEYLPFANTTLSLVGYRNQQVSPSLDNQDIISTGVEIGATQGFLQRFELGMAAGFENDKYVANRADTRARREDNYFYIRPNFSYSFLKVMTATVFYLHRFNDSNVRADTWYNNQVGFELAASF